MRVKDPLRSKQLEKGVQQLAEEGATQMFKPLSKNELIVGAVGVLQFDVVAFRLRDEYRAECIWENTSTKTQITDSSNWACKNYYSFFPNLGLDFINTHRFGVI